MHTFQAFSAPSTSAVWPNHPSSSIKGVLNRFASWKQVAMEEAELKESQTGNSGYYTAVKEFCGDTGHKSIGNQVLLALLLCLCNWLSVQWL